jgi:hypothetical protein
MNMSTPTDSRPLRLWPGVVIVIVQWLMRFALPVVSPELMPLGVMAGLALGVPILLWWVFFSRAAWSERLGALALMAAGMLVTPRFVHESIAQGAMGMLFPILAVPVLSLALVAWAVVTRRISNPTRRASMVAAIFIACGLVTIVRTGGFTADFDNDLHLRWTKTPEERLLAQSDDLPALPPPPPATQPAPPTTPVSPASKAPEETPVANVTDEPAALSSNPAPAKKIADWPGFRGPDRDSTIHGVRIETDWSVSPPVELWRRAIGPGWSSFAVHGDLIYTQEQRGDDEVVACYKATTGEPVWRHRDPVRFWESNAGPGPRGTPTLSNGRVYSLGATAVVNALDAATGAVMWSRNASSDTGAKLPDWGFSSSPLVVDNLVIVSAGSQLIAYDINTGEPRWIVKSKGGSYSSPHLMTIGGVPQVLMLNGGGATSVSAADGAVLWEHAWPGGPIVQPAMIAGGDILITTSTGMAGLGTRRLAIVHGPEGWNVEERWTSNGLKPYFNDYVVHKGHAYGFDGSILASIDLKDGTRKWKGGRYGHGQLVLLPDQDLLLVLSEQGELVLVKAMPDQFTELARFQAIEGKTWNHPALAHDVLLVRNGEQMAAFRMPLAGR